MKRPKSGRGQRRPRGGGQFPPRPHLKKKKKKGLWEALTTTVIIRQCVQEKVQHWGHTEKLSKSRKISYVVLF